jgi:hypothetical protein
MDITNIRTLIENKLACVDIENKTDEHRLDSDAYQGRLRHELRGIKQALQVMGFNLNLSINPYFFEDGKPSTYTLTLD